VDLEVRETASFWRARGALQIVRRNRPSCGGALRRASQDDGSKLAKRLKLPTSCACPRPAAPSLGQPGPICYSQVRTGSPGNPQ